MEKRWGSRGQITVFIIIGIIILFSVSIFMVIRGQTAEFPTDIQERPTTVAGYVEQCMRNVGTDGIDLIGTQGGYATLPRFITADPSRHVSIVPGTNSPYAPKVASWYFDGQSQPVPVNYMESQLQEYVNGNLVNCLNGVHDAFQNEFIIQERSNASSDITINERSVIIKLNYLLDVRETGGGEATTESDYIVELPVKLKRMRDLAEEILRVENENGFLENTTLDLIGLNPDFPISGLEFQCGKRQWDKTAPELQRDLEGMLANVMPGIRFDNTDYLDFEGDLAEYERFAAYTDKDVDAGRVTGTPPNDAYEYFHWYIKGIDNNYQDLIAGVSYKPGWDMHFYPKPSNNGVLQLKPRKIGNSAVKQFMRFICFNFYHFTYDIEFPVIVTLTDETAFNNRQYQFRFSIPVKIESNAPDRSLDIGKLPSLSEPTINECEKLTGTETLIVVRDRFSNYELRDVNLTFTFIRLVDEQWEVLFHIFA